MIKTLLILIFIFTYDVYGQTLSFKVLNLKTAQLRTLKTNLGDLAKFENLIIRTRACHKHEFAPGYIIYQAFIEIWDMQKQKLQSEAVIPKLIFSYWTLNIFPTLQHPTYQIFLEKCEG